jgi:hypothetical protein
MLKSKLESIKRLTGLSKKEKQKEEKPYRYQYIPPTIVNRSEYIPIKEPNEKTTLLRK